MVTQYTPRLKTKTHNPFSAFVAGIIPGILLGMIIMSFLTLIAINIVEQDNDKEVSKLKDQINYLETQITNYQCEIDQLFDEVDRLNGIISTEASNDLALLKKYSYVIDKAPVDGGVSPELILYMDNLCKEKDINPHMVWAIIDIESGFNSRAKNVNSSARGLGQFLSSTGKFVYESFIGTDSYNHAVHAHDPYIGIQLIINYLNYLKLYHMDNVVSMIQNYSGSTDMSYFNKLETQMAAYGSDIFVIDYN